MTHLIELLLNVKTFPVKLAQKIGLEESVVFTHLLHLYAECEFEFCDTFSSRFGIRDIDKCIKNLITYKLLVKKGFKLKIELSQLQEIFYGETESVDNELELLIKRWLEWCKSKGRVYTRAGTLELFKDKTTQVCKGALRLSTGKYLQLYFKDETDSRNSKRIEVRKSGGSTQSEVVGRKNLSEEV